MSYAIHLPQCEGLIDRFSSQRIIVIGDIILDEYIWGDVHRICPEAPVPVVEVIRETRVLGGATNVVKNIASLGGEVSAIGVVGDDPAGRDIVSLLSEIDVDGNSIVADPSRPTSIKTRVIGGNQQIVRFDREKRLPLSGEVISEILKKIEEKWEDTDAIILSDYGKGVLSAPLMKGIQDFNRRAARLIVVDPKEKNMDLYRGVTVVTPNKKEAIGAYGKEIDAERDPLSVIGSALLERFACKYLVITLGSDGMALFSSNREKGQYDSIPTFAKEVFDVSGAGDTVVSTLSLALAAGAAIEGAAILANLAAGIVVGKLGTAAVTADELRSAVRSYSHCKAI